MKYYAAYVYVMAGHQSFLVPSFGYMNNSGPPLPTQEVLP